MTKYEPNPRNGEVYVTQFPTTIYEPDGQEFDGAPEYGWVHMSAGGGSASIRSGFKTPEAAERAAHREARRKNAIYKWGCFR